MIAFMVHVLCTATSCDGRHEDDLQKETPSKQMEQWIEERSTAIIDVVRVSKLVSLSSSVEDFCSSVEKLVSNKTEESLSGHRFIHSTELRNSLAPLIEESRVVRIREAIYVEDFDEYYRVLEEYYRSADFNTLTISQQKLVQALLSEIGELRVVLLQELLSYRNALRSPGDRMVWREAVVNQMDDKQRTEACDILFAGAGLGATIVATPVSVGVGIVSGVYGLARSIYSFFS